MILALILIAEPEWTVLASAIVHRRDNVFVVDSGTVNEPFGSSRVVWRRGHGGNDNAEGEDEGEDAVTHDEKENRNARLNRCSERWTKSLSGRNWPINDENAPLFIELVGEADCET